MSETEFEEIKTNSLILCSIPKIINHVTWEGIILYDLTIIQTNFYVQYKKMSWYWIKQQSVVYKTDQILIFYKICMWKLFEMHIYERIFNHIMVILHVDPQIVAIYTDIPPIWFFDFKTCGTSHHYESNHYIKECYGTIYAPNKFRFPATCVADTRQYWTASLILCDLEICVK